MQEKQTELLSEQGGYCPLVDSDGNYSFSNKLENLHTIFTSGRYFHIKSYRNELIFSVSFHIK